MILPEWAYEDASDDFEIVIISPSNEQFWSENAPGAEENILVSDFVNGIEIGDWIVCVVYFSMADDGRVSATMPVLFWDLPLQRDVGSLIIVDAPSTFDADTIGTVRFKFEKDFYANSHMRVPYF